MTAEPRVPAEAGAQLPLLIHGPPPRLLVFPFFFFNDLNQAELLIDLSAHYNADLGQDELRLQAAAARVSRRAEAGMVPSFQDPTLILIS